MHIVQKTSFIIPFQSFQRPKKTKFLKNPKKSNRRKNILFRTLCECRNLPNFFWEGKMGAKSLTTRVTCISSTYIKQPAYTQWSNFLLFKTFSKLFKTLKLQTLWKLFHSTRLTECFFENFCVQKFANFDHFVFAASGLDFLNSTTFRTTKDKVFCPHLHSSILELYRKKKAKMRFFCFDAPKL